MSGGHYNYEYRRVQDLADQVKQEASLPTVPCWEAQDRRDIATYLREVAEALKALEWYDSGDTGDWSEVREAFRNLKNLPV
jgi:hypothetical protein